MRKSIVAGNWKMNGTLAFAEDMSQALNEYAQALQGVEVVVSPPAVFLSHIQHLAKSYSCSAQNVHSEQSGAYTGEVSLAMLKDIACKYALVGHSERREMFGETDAFISRKVAAAIAGGIVPILCVGETLEQRNTGQANAVVKRQVLSALEGVDFTKDIDSLVIAYEPIWAIGTGETASPEQAQQVHAYIRSVLADNISAAMAQRTRILYGGSVSASTAQSLFENTDIDGGLVGGASLKIEDFKIICSAAADS